MKKVHTGKMWVQDFRGPALTNKTRKVENYQFKMFFIVISENFVAAFDNLCLFGAWKAMYKILFARIAKTSEPLWIMFTLL